MRKSISYEKCVDITHFALKKTFNKLMVFLQLEVKIKISFEVTNRYTGCNEIEI